MLISKMMNCFNTKYMKPSVLQLFTLVCAIGMLATSCNKLDLVPTNDLTADKVYTSAAGYKQSLAKVYGAFALTGNASVGQPDIPVEIIKDEGNSDFLRLYWNLQELTTDEAVWSWQNDAGIQGLHEMSWSSIRLLMVYITVRFFRLHFVTILSINLLRII